MGKATGDYILLSCYFLSQKHTVSLQAVCHFSLKYRITSQTELRDYSLIPSIEAGHRLSENIPECWNSLFCTARILPQPKARFDSHLLTAPKWNLGRSCQLAVLKSNSSKFLNVTTVILRVRGFHAMDAHRSVLFGLSAFALLIHLYRHFQILVVQTQSQIAEICVWPSRVSWH